MDWRVILVEADSDLNDNLVEFLESEGFEVIGLADGKSVLEFIDRQGVPHLMIIDLALPDTEGLELVKDLSQRGTPIIATGQHDSDLAVKALRWADDFVGKPYAPEELVARIRRVLSRIHDFSYAGGPVVDVDSRVSFDYTKNQLIVEEQRVPLTPIESRLLHTLLKHRGQVVDSQTLIMRVWPQGGIFEDTLRVHLHRLRSKIESDPRNPAYILTERGIGYQFRA